MGRFAIATAGRLWIVIRGGILFFERVVSSKYALEDGDNLAAGKTGGLHAKFPQVRWEEIPLLNAAFFRGDYPAPALKLPFAGESEECLVVRCL